MINLNNKGQSLVMFILIIPILLSILILVIDVGTIIVTKQELDNINYLTTEYGLDIIDNQSIENKLINMIDVNTNKVSNIEVVVENNKIKITIKKRINGILAKKFKIYEVTSEYVGYIKDEKKIIERV